jgi:hypothetical protein
VERNGKKEATFPDPHEGNVSKDSRTQKLLLNIFSFNDNIII